MVESPDDDETPPKLTLAQEAAMSLNLCADLDPEFRKRADDEFERLTEVEGMTHDEAVEAMLPMAAERMQRGFVHKIVGMVSSAEDFDALIGRMDGGDGKEG